jgi:PAS domain S-box-containing protein
MPGSVPLSSTPDVSPQPWWRVALLAFAFCAVYVALFRFAVSLPIRAGLAACVWPADGLALAVLLRVSYRQWPVYLLMILLANVTGGYLSGYAIHLDGFVGMNAIQPAAAAWLMRRYLHLPARLDTVRGIIAFTLVSTAVTLVISLIGANDEVLSNGEPYQTLFGALFVADMLGIICVGPFILAWSPESRRYAGAMLTGRSLEAVLVFAAQIAVTNWVFSLAPDARGWVPQYQHLTIPLLVWAALRFGLRGATLALASYAAIAIWHTTNGLGPFVAAHSDPRSILLGLQLYIGMVSIMVLLGGALMTERRDALADSESWRRRFEAAIEASGNLVFEIDAVSGRVVWAGDTVKVMGLATSEINTTRLWTARIHPDDRDSLLKVRRRMIRGEQHAVTLEYRVKRGDGTWMLAGVRAYAVEAPASPLSLGRSRGRRIIGFVEDITEQHHNEQMRKQLEAELRQAQKMEAIGQLAGGIAHDFNNILASILGYGEMAQARAATDPKLRRYLDTIMKAGERGRTLVAQILTFSRKAPVQRQIVRIEDIIDEVVTLVRASNPHEIQYDPLGAAELTVEGDATELHQLFMNLAINGLQAMPGGGALVIRVERVVFEAPHTVLQGRLAAGEYAVVHVHDSGTGIDDATRERMFEPFYTTKAPGRGTGLGLSLALSVAKSHAGGIDVDSASGQGTTFTVYLPVAGSQPALAQQQGDFPRGRDERVLLVDDEPALLDLAEELLVDLGYQVARYGSSEAALAAFQRDPDAYDAVLTDEVMPGLTGTQIAARIRESRADIPILIITGYGGPGFEMRAQQAGVIAVLKKPYQKRELAEALAHAIIRPTP